jgi:hypothetical protein
MTPIQANISGYQGKPCSLFSVYDTEKLILVVSTETEYRKQRRDGCVLISNDRNADRDSLFTELDFSQSINDFFTLLNGVAQDGRSSRLAFNDKVARANPSTSIEKDGYSENGQKLRIDETITNLQIATLATCHYANSKASAIEKTLAMYGELAGLDYWQVLNGGGVITI